jgi:hypothetical protein
MRDAQIVQIVNQLSDRQNALARAVGADSQKVQQLCVKTSLLLEALKTVLCNRPPKFSFCGLRLGQKRIESWEIDAELIRLKNDLAERIKAKQNEKAPETKV